MQERQRMGKNRSAYKLIFNLKYYRAPDEISKAIGHMLYRKKLAMNREKMVGKIHPSYIKPFIPIS